MDVIKKEHVSHLVKFLSEAPESKGWYYVLPSKTIDDILANGIGDNNKNTVLNVFPRFGSLFGFSEDAVKVVLLEMGLMYYKANNIVVDGDRLRMLQHDREIDGKLEFSQCSFNSKRYNLIRIGHIALSPVDIWRNNKKNDNNIIIPRVCSHTSIRDATYMFRQIILGSEFFNSILNNYVECITNNNKQLIVSQEEKTNDQSVLSDSSDSVYTEDTGLVNESEDDDDTTNYYEPEEIPDSKEYPLLHEHGFSFIRDDLLHLSREINKALLETDDKKNNIIKKADGIRFEHPANKKESMMLQIPKGNSHRTFHRLGEKVTTMVQYTPHDNLKISDCATTVIKRLEKDFSYEYDDIATASGYSWEKAEPMTADYWNAMCVEANLKYGQQKIIKKFLTFHFGKRIVVSERELAEDIGEYLPFSVTENKHGNENVRILYRDVSQLLKFYGKAIIKTVNNKKVMSMELALGGDHGKGAFTFIASLVVLFEDDENPV